MTVEVQGPPLVPMGQWFSMTTLVRWGDTSTVVFHVHSALSPSPDLSRLRPDGQLELV